MHAGDGQAAGPGEENFMLAARVHSSSKPGGCSSVSSDVGSHLAVRRLTGERA